MAQEKILIVEDDKNISKILRYNLEKEGFRVVFSADGEAGLEVFRREKPDLVVLDLMLPKLNGFEFCKIVRQERRTPILMLTARKEEIDRILGLEIGADDYVTKPFSVREVMARVKAILRRASDAGEVKAVLRAGTLELDLDKHDARLKGRPLALRFKEFEFLKCLFQARGKAMTRDELLEKVWGYDRSMEIDTRTIDQHINRLREKLGPEAGRIVTVKNVGYRLDVD